MSHSSREDNVMGADANRGGARPRAPHGWGLVVALFSILALLVTILMLNWGSPDPIDVVRDEALLDSAPPGSLLSLSYEEEPNWLFPGDETASQAVRRYVLTVDGPTAASFYAAELARLGWHEIVATCLVPNGKHRDSYSWHLDASKVGEAGVEGTRINIGVFLGEPRMVAEISIAAWEEDGPPSPDLAAEPETDCLVS